MTPITSPSTDGLNHRWFKTIVSKLCLWLKTLAYVKTFWWPSLKKTFYHSLSFHSYLTECILAYWNRSCNELDSKDLWLSQAIYNTFSQHFALAQSWAYCPFSLSLLQILRTSYLIIKVHSGHFLSLLYSAPLYLPKWLRHYQNLLFLEKHTLDVLYGIMLYKMT